MGPGARDEAHPDGGGRTPGQYDNLTRWFIASVFCATNDAYQGPGQFRDPCQSAQWFWVNWDMDQAFRQPDQDTFWYLLSRTGQPRGRRPNETHDRASRDTAR